MIDFHNHLLPGIDDGSPDIETSVFLANGLVDLGFTKFICSPHIISDTHPNTPESINKSAILLNNYASSVNFNMHFDYIAEYMIDDVFYSQLKKKIPFLTFDSKKILTEFSYIQKPNYLEYITFELQVQGYEPILAHPERYVYYHNNLEFYQYLKDLGFYFQLNLLSLTPYYGKNIQKIANHLLKKGMYDFICTDLHHERHLQALQDFFSAEDLQDLYKSPGIKNHQILQQPQN
jgi:protein-tyrosine phosphatase